MFYKTNTSRVSSPHLEFFSKNDGDRKRLRENEVVVYITIGYPGVSFDTRLVLQRRDDGALEREIAYTIKDLVKN